jgi:hypothetical protein
MIPGAAKRSYDSKTLGKRPPGPRLALSLNRYMHRAQSSSIQTCLDPVAKICYLVRQSFSITHCAQFGGLLRVMAPEDTFLSSKNSTIRLDLLGVCYYSFFAIITGATLERIDNTEKQNTQTRNLSIVCVL